MHPIRFYVRQRLQHLLICYQIADIKMSKNLCKWPALENTIQRSLEIDHQTQVVENQNPLVPILTEKNKPNKTISLSRCQFLWMQMLPFVITDLRAFLGSSDHAGNIRKFMRLFSFLCNPPCFHTSVSFSFLEQIQWVLVGAFYC